VMTVWITTDQDPPEPFETARDRKRTAVFAARSDMENVAIGAPFPDRTNSTSVDRLERTALDFVVRRTSPDGKVGTSIIAGYPWFADWGRDTMISLPGLLLVPGRFHQAREVLCVFAQYVDGGMIPNRFGDYDNKPEYNTVDASLWFIHAVFEYLRLSHNQPVFDTVLEPACRKIVDGYRAGTRYHIGMDPADGLITQGDAATQLTWMDAKCGDIAFTPRQGKPVEINALWYHALVLMGEAELAAKVGDSFRKAFWISPFRGLADVIDGDRKDTRVRPNQIFAVSLPNSPLLPDQQIAVVEVVRRELLTPVGLRTLAKTEPGYRGTYTGPQFDRDGAYHNGTVWPWLIGAFLEAYLKVHARSSASLDQARAWLAPLVKHMDDTAAIGQISEIFEGDEPHRPVGCPAQAWSVAEVLRLAVDLGI
jgi:predicted glycogen debranching enzyme